MSDEIRSYHEAYSMELEVHSIGNMRPWKPIPARGLFWGLVALAVMAVLANVPPTSFVVSSLGWEADYLILPLCMAWALSTAKPEGRRVHAHAWAALRHVSRARHLNGAFEPVREPKGRWRPREIRVVPDRRER